MRGIIYAAIAGAMIWTLLLMGCTEDAGLRPEDRAQCERVCTDGGFGDVSGWDSFMRAGDARWLNCYCGPEMKMRWEVADAQ
jgi:hypothetical protein